jgi:hypothetical protein
VARFEHLSHDGPAQSRIAFESVFDRAYCVALEDRPMRKAAAAKHFRDMGLSGSLTFYLPQRGRHFPRAVWTSHREMARHALKSGMKRVLILEEDANFHVGAEDLKRRLDRAVAKLPLNWWGLFLGHLPLQLYPVAWGVARTRSAAAHAYLANTPLLQWLAEAEPMDPEIPVCAIGASIDAAFANLPEMYALVPMIATQRAFGENRFDPKYDEKGRRRPLLDPQRYRSWALSDGLRVAELVGLASSPFHRLTLERFRRRSGQRLARAARELRASAGFDEEWYLRAYPDVAESGRMALEHYLRDGRKEGRMPRGSA